MAAADSATAPMQPQFQRAAFLSAASDLRHAPPDLGFEVAFAGRSNAGKSSAINGICHQNSLARTSRTPGRTQQLVFFRIDDERRLVDLPGYGFARVSVAVKSIWQRLMADYLRQRQSLRGLVVLMDIRHPLMETDRQMLDWSQTTGLPLLVVLTKADKLKRAAAMATVARVERALAPTPAEVLAFSAPHRQGIVAVQQWVAGRLCLPELDAGDSGADRRLAIARQLVDKT